MSSKVTMYDSSSCSSDDNVEKIDSLVSSSQICNESTISSQCERVKDQYEKFQNLKMKADEIRKNSYVRAQKTELRKSKKLIKKAMKDPSIKKEIESQNEIDNKDEVKQTENWSDIKPFLNVNSHLHGPISHGDYRPKTELESKIEDSIKRGDFEEAEILSDTLANREFAVKISQAFSAKRCSEELEVEKEKEKEKQRKKIRWTFEAKERWQMKGNM